MDVSIYIVLAVVFGGFMAWGIGANDVANAMATSVGSKAITIKQAVIIAAIFEFSGAFLAGGQVTSTIRKGIIDPSGVDPEILILGMLSSLLAAGSWLVIASMRGWPVSTTHSIVGAIVGFALVAMGYEAVQWGKIWMIAASWIVSPLLAGSIALLIAISFKRLIFESENPLKSAQRYAPLYIFLAVFIVVLVTITKGLKHVGLDLTLQESVLIAMGVGVVTAIIGLGLVKRLKVTSGNVHVGAREHIQKVFTVLMIFTACAMAFAHGSNDVANAIGPVAAVVSISSTHAINADAAVPLWILLMGSCGIVLGLVTYGQRVIATVGSGITELTPSKGFAATLAAAMTVVVASGLGLPISTTHTLVGAILGVGIACAHDVNLHLMRTIFLSWVITIPVGALFSIVFFYLLKWILL